MTTIDIVGAGLSGLSIARELLSGGLSVRVWERAAHVGGMIGRRRLDGLGGLTYDRSYHTIHGQDRRLLHLIESLGLRSSLQVRNTRMGFYHGGRTYPLSTPLEFLRFPPLNLFERAQLAYTIQAARQIRDWHALDRISAMDWLRELGGERVLNTIWKPLLQAKFDGRCDDVPATYIWSRLLRTSAAYDHGSREGSAMLAGGAIQLIHALAADITARGGTITRGAAVEQIWMQGGQAAGLIVAGQPIQSDGVVVTIPTPLAQRVLPREMSGQYARWGRLSAYLSKLSVLFVLRRRLSPYYMLNITDSRVPFSGLIETTNLLDVQACGGYHLVYVPKYVHTDSPFARMSDDELAATFRAQLFRMFPDLREGDIAAVQVERDRYAEPLHGLGQADDIAPIVGDVPRLFLANAAQIYPHLVNGESVVAHAARAAEAIQAALRPVGRERAAPALVSAPAAD